MMKKIPVRKKNIEELEMNQLDKFPADDEKSKSSKKQKNNSNLKENHQKDPVLEKEDDGLQVNDDNGENKQSSEFHTNPQILTVDLDNGIKQRQQLKLDEEDQEHIFDDETEAVENKIFSFEDITKMREELDDALNQWRSQRDNAEKSKEIWKKFEAVTSSLAQDLCEQLRLIIEPTLATKLKGDFKTGKRINMKKVISYIASSFRKDKIWLKRVKPNKRQYHVMIGIDDSKSMSLNNAGNIACEALIVICKAMSQLEVGDMAIMSFGESVRLLHPFEKPFSDDSGTEIISQFTFAQKQTQISQFLKQSVRILDLYRGLLSNKSNAEQVQLTFIISDGRLLEREDVVKLVREAQAKMQLIVFILIDQNEKDSVMDLKTISYPNNKLTIEPYIDQFPFPYYILLRDIRQLPEILADSLRQWFELMMKT